MPQQNMVISYLQKDWELLFLSLKWVNPNCLDYGDQPRNHRRAVLSGTASYWNISITVYSQRIHNRKLSYSDLYFSFNTNINNPKFSFITVILFTNTHQCLQLCNSLQKSQADFCFNKMVKKKKSDIHVSMKF